MIPETDMWYTNASDMQYGHSKFAASVHNGKIYVFCSNYPGSLAHKKSEVYDPSANVWSNISEPPVRVIAATPTSINGIIYLLGLAVDGNPLLGYDLELDKYYVYQNLTLMV